MDRDANASKIDEPDVPSLLDYSSPDKVISALIMGKYESGPAECAEASTFNSQYLCQRFASQHFSR